MAFKRQAILRPADPNSGPVHKPGPTSNKIPQGKGKPNKHKSAQKGTSRHAMPGSAESSKRKPLPRGEPFQPANSLISWSTR